MGPQNRNGQLATLGDIKMLAENIGQIEGNHRRFVENINDIVSWVKTIDQAAFIAIHFHVNGNLDFTEETAKKTTDFIEKGRAAMEAYQEKMNQKAQDEVLAVVGNDFAVEAAQYKRQDALEVGGPATYTRNGVPISEDEFLRAANTAYTIYQESKPPEEDLALQAQNDKQIAANEAQQAPAEPEAPTSTETAEQETTNEQDGSETSQ